MTNLCRIDKDRIERNFSKYAHLYDRHADIQRLVADKLAGELPGEWAGDILEIGCGTANYTLLLKERFASARIKAVDISGGMIEVARDKCGTGTIEFIKADAEEVGIPGQFDLITSNVSFQWFDNLEGAIEIYRRALNEKGAISFSTFGPLTFRELRHSLKWALDENISISSDNFLGGGELENMLQKYFKETAVKELIIERNYISLMELLSNIKYTGAAGNGLNNNVIWKKGLLDRVEEIYMSEFGRIEATYQIFLCKGLK